jgi:hypothetical protein
MHQPPGASLYVRGMRAASFRVSLDESTQGFSVQIQYDFPRLGEELLLGCFNTA